MRPTPQSESTYPPPLQGGKEASEAAVAAVEGAPPVVGGNVPVAAVSSGRYGGSSNRVFGDAASVHSNGSSKGGGGSGRKGNSCGSSPCVATSFVLQWPPDPSPPYYEPCRASLLSLSSCHELEEESPSQAPPPRPPASEAVIRINDPATRLCEVAVGGGGAGGASSSKMLQIVDKTSKGSRLLDKNHEQQQSTEQQQYNLLISAAGEGRVEVVRELLQQGACVDAADKTKRTGLMRAAHTGHIEVIRLLLEAGAQVNFTDEYNSRTALMLAAEEGRTEVARLLLEAGAHVNTANELQRTALMLAVGGGHVGVVGLLLEAGAEVNNADIQNRRTSLMLAARCGHLKIVRMLLAAGALVWPADQAGRTALMLAARDGHVDVVHLLLEARASLEATDESGMTALMLASEEGRTEVVRLLLAAGADANAKDQGGNTSLMLAASKGQMGIQELLLEAGADANAADKLGRTALMLAIAGNGGSGDSNGGVGRLVEVLKALLAAGGARVDTADAHGRTGLLLASGSGQLDGVKVLLEAGADITITDQDDMSALLYAAIGGHLAVVELLLDFGARGADLAEVPTNSRAARRQGRRVLYGKLYESATRGGLKRLCVELASNRNSPSAPNLTPSAVAPTTTSTTICGSNNNQALSRINVPQSPPLLLPRPEVLVFVVRVMLAAGQDLLCSHLVSELLPRSIARSWPGAQRTLLRMESKKDGGLQSESGGRRVVVIGCGGPFTLLLKEMQRSNTRLLAQLILSTRVPLFTRGAKHRAAAACLTLQTESRSASPLIAPRGASIGRNFLPLAFTVSGDNPGVSGAAYHTSGSSFAFESVERKALAALYEQPQEVERMGRRTLSSAAGELLATVRKFVLEGLWRRRRCQRRRGQENGSGKWMQKGDEVMLPWAGIVKSSWDLLLKITSTRRRQMRGHWYSSVSLALVHLGPTGLMAAAFMGFSWLALLILLQPLLLLGTLPIQAMLACGEALRALEALRRLHCRSRQVHPRDACAAGSGRQLSQQQQQRQRTSAFGWKDGVGSSDSDKSVGGNGDDDGRQDEREPSGEPASSRLCTDDGGGGGGQRYTVSLSEVRLPGAATLLSPGMLARLLADPRVDPRLWTSPSYTAMMELRWLVFTRHVIQGMFLIRLANLAVFIVYILSFHGTGMGVAEEGRTQCYSPSALQRNCMVVLAIMTAEYGIMEVRQLMVMGVLQWFSQAWNLFDAAQIALMCTTLVLHWSCAAPLHVVRCLGAVLVLVLFWRLFEYVMAVPGLGSFVRMVMEVTWDLRWFFVFLGTIFCGFGLALQVLYLDVAASSSSSDGEDINNGGGNSAGGGGLPRTSPWTTASHVFGRLYTMIFGDFDVELLLEPGGGGSQRVPWSLSVLAAIICSTYMLFVTVILLNLLIAVIGDAYDRVCKDELLHVARSKAALLVETELLLPRWFRRLRDQALLECDSLLIMQNELVAASNGDDIIYDTRDGDSAGGNGTCNGGSLMAGASRNWRGRLGETQALLANTENLPIKAMLRDQADRQSREIREQAAAFESLRNQVENQGAQLQRLEAQVGKLLDLLMTRVEAIRQ